jgi:invasion protein IalB
MLKLYSNDSEPLQVQFLGYVLYSPYGLCLQTSVSIVVTRRDIIQKKPLRCVVSGCVVKFPEDGTSMSKRVGV